MKSRDFRVSLGYCVRVSHLMVKHPDQNQFGADRLCVS